MSDMNTPFAQKILDDKDFDTIFGAEEDNELMEAVLGGDDLTDDDRDFGGIEDGTGPIGKGSGYGSDLGPGHDTKGPDAPKEDTSDVDLIDKLDSYKQDSVIDAYKADPTQKAANIDPQNINDSTDKLKKTNSFEDVYSDMLKEAEEEMEKQQQQQNNNQNQQNNQQAQDECGDGSCGNDQKPEDECGGDLVDQLDSPEEPPVPAQAAPYAPAPAAAPADDSGFAGGEYEADPFEEDADFAEMRNNAGINDNNMDNLGDNMGPGHDANKPADDTSDEDIIAAVAGETLNKGDQLNTGDNAQGSISDGGALKGNDFTVAGDDRDAAADDYGPHREASILDIVAFGEDSALATEEEDDALMRDAENDEAPSPFNTADLNEDEDDDIMSAVLGGR